jgi:antagonist of KipI
MFRIVDPGAFTTVQDLGRFAYQRFGVPLSGALDQFSYRIANLLVGNPESAAALELTYKGPKLEFLSQALVCVAGADMPLLVNGTPRSCWEAFSVHPGDILDIRSAAKGLRAYLAIAGGIEVPPIMGSRSTCSAARFGGKDGRAVAKDDILNAGIPLHTVYVRRLPEQYRSTFPDEMVIRALPGPQRDFFENGTLFFEESFVVSDRANRMGYRLEGHTIDFRKDVPKGIISEPVVPGVVQIPPDGKPIIILVEQTMGGYAKIAAVITPDLNKVAQARPGQKIRFREVTLSEALEALLDQQRILGEIRSVIK